MGKMINIEKKILDRRCFTCGEILHYRDYLIITHRTHNRKKFGWKMLIEIWNNNIFVLNCCKCHKIRMSLMERKDCPHEEGTKRGYFTHRGIERKGMYCKNCNQLLDYYPQYNED